MLDYKNFKEINDYIRHNRKQNNKIIVKISDFDERSDFCVIKINEIQQKYPLSYIINGVIAGNFCLTNPSVFAKINFDKFLNKSKPISLSDLKKKNKSAFYYKNKSIPLYTYSNSGVIVNPKLHDEIQFFTDKSLARSFITKGKLSNFTLSTESLKVLDLSQYNCIFHVVLFAYQNDLFDNVVSKNILCSKYLIDINEYDCIHRYYIPDEMLFDFLSGIITDKELDNYIKTSYKYFELISKKAFSNLEFVKFVSVNNLSCRTKDDYNCLRLNGKYISDYING